MNGKVYLSGPEYNDRKFERWNMGAAGRWQARWERDFAHRWTVVGCKYVPAQPMEARFFRSCRDTIRELEREINERLRT